MGDFPLSCLTITGGYLAIGHPSCANDGHSFYKSCPFPFLGVSFGQVSLCFIPPRLGFSETTLFETTYGHLLFDHCSAARESCCVAVFLKINPTFWWRVEPAVDPNIFRFCFTWKIANVVSHEKTGYCNLLKPMLGHNFPKLSFTGSKVLY